MDRPELDARGWMMVIACMLGVAVCVIPVAILSMGVFIKPLSAAFGWGRAEITLSLTILCIAMAITLPFSGQLMDRLGVRTPLLASLLLYAACVALLPIAIAYGGLTGLYVDAALMGVLGAPSSNVAYVKIVSGWFDRSRGAALGITMCGVSVGASIAPILAATTIERYGWEAGFYILSLLPVVIGVPVALLVREAPHVHAARSSAIGASLPGMTFAEASRTRTFATLFVAFLIAATAIHGIQIHLAPLLSDRGLEPRDAALGVTFMFVVSTVMRLVTGYLFDRTFAPWVGAVCFFAAAIGSILLLLPGAGVVAILAVALLGIGAGAESDLMAMLVSRYFGLRSFGMIYGATGSAFMAGSALGPLLLGINFDSAGSYSVALIWCAGGMLATTALLLTLPRFPHWRGVEAGEPDRPAAGR